MDASGQDKPTAPGTPVINSLKDLIDAASGRNIRLSDTLQQTGETAGNDVLPYPFQAIVGQYEMKLALLLSLINPSLGGVLLLGPRGTGKTTAVRSLLPLLPMVERSNCIFGCLPEDIETGGMDAVCPECAEKYARGVPLTKKDVVRMVEIPLNATLDDVVGGLDERIAKSERFNIKRGLLSQADQNILYIDEVNLLPDDITDAILDASAQGRYTLRRGLVSASYRSRFNLIGSMNPEEGRLRPQIMDRFGLRVIVQRLETMEQRLEAYRRVHAYLSNPIRMSMEFMGETVHVQKEVLKARELCRNTTLDEVVSTYGIALIQEMKIDSLRADITLFEAARAYAAADNRQQVTRADVDAIAPMALRLRRSRFMDDYFAQQKTEEEEITKILQNNGM